MKPSTLFHTYTYSSQAVSPSEFSPRSASQRLNGERKDKESRTHPPIMSWQTMSLRTHLPSGNDLVRARSRCHPTFRGSCPGCHFITCDRVRKGLGRAGRLIGLGAWVYVLDASNRPCHDWNSMPKNGMMRQCAKARECAGSQSGITSFSVFSGADTGTPATPGPDSEPSLRDFEGDPKTRFLQLTNGRTMGSSSPDRGRSRSSPVSRESRRRCALSTGRANGGPVE